MAKIRVARKAYYRKPYTRADGVRVKGGYVKSASFLIDDPGKPGRRSRGTKSGKYRKAPRWITHEEALGGPGYAHKSDKTRHDLLKDSVKRDGYATTIRRLYVLLRSSTMHADARKVIKADVTWMKRGRELAKASAKMRTRRAS
jgi:hypothetical protein